VVGLHRILPEHIDAYLENARLHARNSAAEPGCRRYEVLQDTNDPTVICLFEVFQNEAAFQTHIASEHYKWWMTLSRGWRAGPPIDRHVMDFVTPPPGDA
jgi:quinol monooxygenase YgiN